MHLKTGSTAYPSTKRNFLPLLRRSTNEPERSDSLRRRANTRNVSFRISLRWLTYIVNSVDKTKLSCNTPTDAAPLTVSLETYPLYLINKVDSIYISFPWFRFTLMDRALRVLFHRFQTVFDRIRQTFFVATGTKSTNAIKYSCLLG